MPHAQLMRLNLTPIMLSACSHSCVQLDSGQTLSISAQFHLAAVPKNEAVRKLPLLTLPQDLFFVHFTNAFQLHFCYCLCFVALTPYSVEAYSCADTCLCHASTCLSQPAPANNHQHLPLAAHHVLITTSTCQSEPALARNSQHLPITTSTCQ